MANAFFFRGYGGKSVIIPLLIGMGKLFFYRVGGEVSDVSPLLASLSLSLIYFFSGGVDSDFSNFLGDGKV